MENGRCGLANDYQPEVHVQALKNDQLVPYPDSGHGALVQYPELFVSHVSLFLNGNKCGVPADPIQLSAFPLVFGARSIYGSLTGTSIDTEDALAFSVLQNIRPMIETLPLEQAADAYARMMQGKARFRMVLTMNA